MNRPSRRFVGACAALWLSLALALVGGVAANAATYTKESQQEYAKQLDAGEIKSATFNRKVRSIHLTLKDGRLVLVRYAKGGFHPEEAKLKAKRVPVSVLGAGAADKELKAKPKAHKLRYIAAGIVIVVVVIVGLVLLVNRRRQRD